MITDLINYKLIFNKISLLQLIKLADPSLSVFFSN